MGMIRSMTRHINEVNRRKRYLEDKGTMIGYRGYRTRQRAKAESVKDTTQSNFQRFKDKNKAVFTSKFNLRRSQKR